MFDDPEHSVEEERFLILGITEHERLFVSHCYRGEDNVIRIISARKATKNVPGHPQLLLLFRTICKIQIDKRLVWYARILALLLKKINRFKIDTPLLAAGYLILGIDIKKWWLRSHLYVILNRN